ncbi:MAG: recombinase family protein [Weizmannia coagulans]|jgi:site-specific DNA recombinase|nr:recombinase family protein [Heyndrickxia coagulans]
MKAVIYVRVSTDEQAKHGYSIPAQIEKLEAFCVSQGWEVAGTFVDDGYSAKDLNRPKFTLMMDEIKKGGIDVLLVYRLDRLTRSVLDLYKILQFLDEHGCKFRSATEVYDTTNAMGRLFITLVAAIAQWERENLAERVKMGIDKKIKLGKWKGGTAPYGYVYEDDRLIVNPEEAKIVKIIFDLAKKHGFLTVARRLTELGFPTRGGEEWHVDTARGIATNPVYAGYLTNYSDPADYKKPPDPNKLYEGIHERIIPREEFWEIQEIINKRRKGGGKKETSPYYFSNLLKCARCGHSMSGHRGGKYEKTYRCSGQKAGKSCSSHIIMEKYLVKKVFETFDDLIDRLNLSGRTHAETASEEKIKELENELKSIEKKMKKQKAMFERDIIDIDELVENTEKLREKEKKLTAQLRKFKQSPKNTQDVKYLVENFKSLWDLADEYERKQMMGTLFSQIVIDTSEQDFRWGRGRPREIIIVSVK